MIYIAIAVLSLTAILGLYLLSLLLRNKSTPKGVTIIHGLMAAAALILIIIYSFVNKPSPWESVIALVIAALGGFMLNYRDITGKSVPKWLGIGHGLVAITGFALLIYFAFFCQ